MNIMSGCEKIIFWKQNERIYYLLNDKRKKLIMYSTYNNR